MTGESNLSIADIASVVGRNNGDFYGANGELWMMMMFFLLFGGNGMYGRGGYYGNEMFEGFNNQNVMRKLDGITQGLCDGFYAVNTNNLQMQNQLQRDLCQGFAAVNAGISENRFAAQHCCCETNRNIDAVRYEAAKNTSDIITAANSNTQRILDAMCADRTQALRDKLADKDRELTAAQLVLAQGAQTKTILDSLGKYYPKEGVNPYANFGNGCGCCGY
jgi:hypothetical protein